MLLSERLQGVVDILIDSNAELQSPKADATGFIPALPDLLAEAVVVLLQHTDTKKVSLDIGCGNGGWMLLAAAAGFPSYGIEINPFLVDHCQRNYERAVAAGFIDKATPCAWITGDMIPVRFAAAYDIFRKAHEQSMPIGDVVEDAYERLPTSIATADIIYCWSWPTQSRFLYNMLESEAKADALFILPSYEKYVQHDYLNAPEKNRLLLSQLGAVQTIFVGRRQASTSDNV